MTQSAIKCNSETPDPITTRNIFSNHNHVHLDIVWLGRDNVTITGHNSQNSVYISDVLILFIPTFPAAADLWFSSLQRPLFSAVKSWSAISCLSSSSLYPWLYVCCGAQSMIKGMNPGISCASRMSSVPAISSRRSLDRRTGY